MKKHWILWNLSGALLFVVAVVIGISVGLNRITRHGKTVVAPDFTNMSLSEAARAASEGKVGIKVTDSVSRAESCTGRARAPGLRSSRGAAFS